MVAKATVGAVARLPSTTWLAESATAWLPRFSNAFAVPPLLLMLPPFNASALAPTLMPFASASAAWTTYWNTMPLPNLVWRK